MNNETQKNKKYLNQKVNPILENLVASLMKNRPEQPLDFMMLWLDKKGYEI